MDTNLPAIPPAECPETLPPEFQAEFRMLADLGAKVAGKAIRRAAPKQPEEREALAHRFNQVRHLMAGPTDDPLLAVLGESMALNWLNTCAEDAADHDQELQTQYSKDDRYQVRAHRAQRRLLETARTMAQVRRILSAKEPLPCESDHLDS
jgi:hypothetical protein